MPQTKPIDSEKQVSKVPQNKTKEKCEHEYLDEKTNTTKHCIEGRLYDEGYNLQIDCPKCKGTGYKQSASSNDEGLVPVSKETMDRLRKPKTEKEKQEFIESITHTQQIKELKERIAGYKTAMVSREQQHEKEIKELKEESIYLGNLVEEVRKENKDKLNQKVKDVIFLRKECSKAAGKVIELKQQLSKTSGKQVSKVSQSETIKIEEVEKIIDDRIDFIWGLEQLEKALAKHHSPAENIMNIVTHLIARQTELKQKLTKKEER